MRKILSVHFESSFSVQTEHKMSLYLFTAVIALLSVLLYKIRHYFNTDIYRNYGSEKLPEVRNGFKVAVMDPGEF